MNAASQVPSGVLISTSVSTISMPMSAAAADDDDTDAAMPAPTKRAAKSRRVMSPGWDWLLGWFFSSSVMAFSCKFFVQRVYRISLADRTRAVAMVHLILGGAAVHRCDNWLHEIMLGEILRGI